MGDLNLTPDSTLYNFIATGELDCSAHNPRSMSGQQESRAERQVSTPGRHSLHGPQVFTFAAFAKSEAFWNAQLSANCPMGLLNVIRQQLLMRSPQHNAVHARECISL